MILFSSAIYTTEEAHRGLFGTRPLQAWCASYALVVERTTVRPALLWAPWLAEVGDLYLRWNVCHEGIIQSALTVVVVRPKAK